MVGCERLERDEDVGNFYKLLKSVEPAASAKGSSPPKRTRVLPLGSASEQGKVWVFTRDTDSSNILLNR